MVKIILALLLSFGLFASATTRVNRDRLNPIRVENGTHFSREGSTLSYSEPNGNSVRKELRMDANNQEKRLPINGWYTSLWTFGTYTTNQMLWEVPPVPTSNVNQILFFFNSFESAAENDILQPVLQYNNGVAGWTLASWYGDPSGNYYESTPVAVNPGDLITGIISLSGSTWTITGGVNGYVASQITVSTSVVGSTQGNAQWALEVYGVSSCANLPPTCAAAAGGIYLANGGVEQYPSWQSEIFDSADCSPGAFGSWDTAVLTWIA